MNAHRWNIFISARNWHRSTFLNYLFNPFQLNMLIFLTTRMSTTLAWVLYLSLSAEAKMWEDEEMWEVRCEMWCKFKKSTFSRPTKLIRETKDNMKMSDGGYNRSYCDTFYTEESLNCSSSFPHRKHGNTKIFCFIKTFYRVLSVSLLPIMILLSTRVKLKKMTKLYNYHYTCIYTSLLYSD